MMRGLIAHTLNQFHDEEAQVNGVLYFIDATGFGIKHQTYFSMEENKKSINLFQVYLLAMYIILKNLVR